MLPSFMTLLPVWQQKVFLKLYLLESSHREKNFNFHLKNKQERSNRNSSGEKHESMKPKGFETLRQTASLGTFMISESLGTCCAFCAPREHSLRPHLGISGAPRFSLMKFLLLSARIDVPERKKMQF